MPKRPMQWLSRLPTERVVAAGFAVALALLLAVGIASYRSLQYMEDTFHWVIHSQDVLAEIAGVEIAIRAIESEQRGFVISGKQEFLASHEENQLLLNRHLRALRSLTSDNSIHQDDVAQLDDLLSARVAFSNRVIEVRTNSGDRAANRLVAGGRGLYLQNQIGAVLAKMRALEADLLRAREDRVAAVSANTNAMIRGSEALALLIIALAYVRIRTDLASRVRARQLLEEKNALLEVARHEAEAANRTKSAFLATMSHELRTPLTSIIGFTGVLAEGMAGPLNETQSKQLRIVQSSAQHLLALINDVLDISKIEAGELRLRDEPFDPLASAVRVLDSIRPLAERKGLETRMLVPAAMPPARGDPRRFEQMILNLLSNAIKFTAQGSVTLEISAAAPWITVSVTDTGAGIQPGDMDRLFRPFQQLDSSLARQHEGTGLGLDICRRLAELMGGTIEASSEWGAGSRFTFRLPLLQEGAG